MSAAVVKKTLVRLLSGVVVFLLLLLNLLPQSGADRGPRQGFQISAAGAVTSQQQQCFTQCRNVCRSGGGIFQRRPNGIVQARMAGWIKFSTGCFSASSFLCQICLNFCNIFKIVIFDDAY